MLWPFEQVGMIEWDQRLDIIVPYELYLFCFFLV